MKSRFFFIPLLLILLFLPVFPTFNSGFQDLVPEISNVSSVSDRNEEGSNHLLVTSTIHGKEEGSVHLPVPSIIHGDEEGSENLPVPSKSPGSGSMLSLPNKHGVALFASSDGTIHLVDITSREVHWSFSSGPALSSSYQAYDKNASVLGEKHDTESYIDDNYFVECGDDWNLYAHTRQFGSRKLPMTIEKYVDSTPHFSDDGGVTLGEKKTTVFQVDARNGRVIHVFTNAKSVNDKQRLVLSKQDTEEWLKSSSTEMQATGSLYITRTDYILQSFFPGSNKVVWNMTVAKADFHYLCPTSDSRLGLEYQGDEMPLTCHVKGVVHRLHGHSLLPSDFALFQLNNLPKYPHEDDVLFLSAPQTRSYSPLTMIGENRMPHSQPKNSCNSEETCLMEIDDDGIKVVAGIFPEWQKNFIIFALIVTFIIVVFLIADVVAVVYYGKTSRLKNFATLALKKFYWFNSNKQPSDLNGKQGASTKRRKSRKTGNNKNNGSTNSQHMSSENVEAEINKLTNVEGTGSLLNITRTDGDGDGRWVGKLFMSNKEIAKGSNGTVVFEGVYDCFGQVAVKRLALSHNDVAFKEIEHLIASKRHANIVHFYGVEKDLDFVYLSLERCTCSLNDLIQSYSDTLLNPLSAESPASNSATEYKVRLQSIKGTDKGIDLWKTNGYPSSQLLNLMRDVVSGLAHLHKLGIIHRDLKPQNVLITYEESLCAKLSDMGISKRLYDGMSSLDHHATGYGSTGWRAPEQLLHGRQTRAVDLFSLGCVLFFCITKGGHPFGEPWERDANIVKNHFDFFLVEHIPEAVDLLSQLLDPNPEKRPKAKEVLHHPLFWDSKMRLSFLQAVSEELEDREGESNILKALENVAPVALGGNWDEKMEASFITNIGSYRRYKYDSVCDLLRLIRNKCVHYASIPKEIQDLLGPKPEGYYGYFASRFPKLLIEVYKVVCRYRREKERYSEYFCK